jgi:hypothetical protein
MRKEHMKHTVKFGPTCQNGKSGASLAGREHITVPFVEFVDVPQIYQCEKCLNSKLFKFLSR